ncbi:MAG: flagellar hook-basal body complex protein FliE [Planctomycetota bacterium]
MADPLGLIGNAGNAGRPDLAASRGVKTRPDAQGGPDFKDALLANLEQVNEAQQDADKAVEDLVSGRRSDVEGVILATQKADNAFRMLQAVRGKVMAAYDEIRQTSV